MQPSEFRLVSWLLGRSREARFNLASSGLTEPDIPNMGIDTSYEHFAHAQVDHEALMKEKIAELYRVDPENIVLTSGASEAIFIAFAAFGQGKTALVPLPNYEPIFLVPKALRMKVSHSLAAPPGRNSMYGLTDPNNPRGLRLDDDGEEMLIDAAKKGATVFVNETYKEFAFRSRPDSLFQKEDGLITCTSMTKFYGLSWLRVGWLVADRKKARRMYNTRQLMSAHNSEYSLWIAKQVLDRRREFVGRARKIYDGNLALVRKFAKSVSGLRVKLPDAAPFCLARYDGGQSSVSLADELFKKKGILVSPGDYFGAPRAFRLCFTIEGRLLERALGELSGFIATRSHN